MVLADLWTDWVRPEWVDYNGHLNDGYYAVCFSRACDAFLDCVGLDDATRKATGATLYTMETHVCFLREVKQGAPLAIDARLLEHDAKRARVFLTMREREAGFTAATSEQLLLSIDLSTGAPRVAPWRDATKAILDRLAAADAGSPWPEGAGRAIALKRSPGSR